MTLLRPSRTGPDASWSVSPGPLARLGGWSYRRRRFVVVIWVAVLLGLTIVGHGAGTRFKTDINGGNTQSQQATAFLEKNVPSQAGDLASVVFSSKGSITSAQNLSRVTAAVNRLARSPGVQSVLGPYGSSAHRLISSNGHVAYVVVQFKGVGDAIASVDVRRVEHIGQAQATNGLSVQFGGAPIEHIESPSFGVSEGLGILAAVVILLLAFGSVIAMILPIVTAVVAVAATFGVLDLLSHRLTVPNFAPELAALVGLAVGIDYALFVVSRYRNLLHAGSDPEQAVRGAMATSGRAVVFAGSTVVLSLFGLFLLGLPFIYGAALGTIVAVLLVMVASVTLLPAALGFAGHNIDRLHVGRRRTAGSESGHQGFWSRWASQVQRRPWLTGGLAVLVLVVLALPFASMRLAFTDAGTDPQAFTTRHAFDLISQNFGPGRNGPLVIALSVPQPSDRPVVASLDHRLAGLGDVASLSPPAYDSAGTAAVITVVPKTSPQDARTSALVQQIRSTVVPSAMGGSGITALVGGETAASIDTAGVISEHLALVLTFVVLLGLVLLVLAFRSITIPIASAIVTLLSTGVAYGVVVAVFQWGWLGSGIEQGTTAPVDPWIPVMLFTILFGLSMDYQVFLVSRIREAYDRGADPSSAVTEGLSTTGRVITSAAAIMICVFGAFVLGDVRILRVFGLGMAAAILLDATLVRIVLMPSVLQIMGPLSWWFPRSWDRLVPRVLSPTGDTFATAD
jgi:putative drug exporter of the RND superfamily